MANPITNALGRLPRPQASREAFLFAVYTFVLFFVFLVLTMPHDLLVRGVTQDLERSSGWKIQFDDVSLVPWAGYRFDRLSLTPGTRAGSALLTANILDVRPTIQSIVGGHLSTLAFSGELYRGEVSGNVRSTEPRSLDLAWSDVELGAVPALLELVQGRWQGRLSGSVNLQVGEGAAGTEGEGRLELRGASLTEGSASGFTVPDLTGVAGDADLVIKGGRLEIRSLKITGEQADIDVRGQIYLREPFGQSVLNATVTAKPVPGNSSVDGLFRLMNRGRAAQGGAYKFTLYGLVSAPKVR